MLEIILENKCLRLSFFGRVSFFTGDFQIELYHSASHHFEILNSIRVTFWDHCHQTVGFLNFVLLSEHLNRVLVVDRAGC